MKKALCLILVCIFVFTSTACSKPTSNKPAYTAIDYVNSFINAGLPVDNVIDYDEETDTNGLLGRPGQYTSKVNFADSRIEQYDESDPLGGTVEVFNSKSDLQKRKEYIESIRDAAEILASQYIYVSKDGLVLLRVEFDLTPEQADEYKMVLDDIDKYIGLEPPAETVSTTPATTTAPTPEPTIAPTPIPTPEPTPLVDFFTDQARVDLYNSYYQSFQFKELMELVDSYISESDVSPGDSAYKIKELVGEPAANIDSCKINHDDFNNDYSVYYDGIEKIGTKINVVPFITGSEFRVIFGFHKSDWLFFDGLDIKTGQEQYISLSFNYYDVSRDVGGGISEYVDIYLDPEQISQIVNSTAPVVRFSNDDDDKYYDHVMTPDEVSALKVISNLREAYVELENLVYNFQN